MPRKVDQYPKSRKVTVPQKVNTEAPKIQLPDHHPVYRDITPTPIEVARSIPRHEPPKIQPLDIQKHQNAMMRRARHITLGITTYNRPQHLMRLLQSLVSNTDSTVMRRIEIIIADDGSKRENRLVIEGFLRNFTAEYSVNLTYLYGERRGVAKNKNRCIYSFLTNPMSSELLLLDDDVLFLNRDWWHYLEKLAAYEGVGHFGSLPWGLDSLKLVDPKPMLPPNIQTVIPGPGDFDITNQTFGHILWVRRDWLMSVKYMNPEFGRYGYEHCLWSQRINKANGLPMFDFHVARDMNRYLLLCDRSAEESWDTQGERDDCIEPGKERYLALLEDYSGKPRHSQLVLNHGISDFEVEWSSAMRCRFSSQVHRADMPRVVQREETYHFKDIDETWKTVGADDYVTVVIGVRGHGRSSHLLRTINSLYAQKVPVRIIVVEQDTFPHCRALIESHVDTYLFAYSDRPYNRSWAFNCGAREALSTYVLLHDGDLIVPEDYLTLALKEAKGRDLVVPWGTIHYLSPEATERWPDHPEYHTTLTSENIHGGSVLVKKTFFLQVKGMDERFWGWGAEDDAFFAVAMRLGTVKVLTREGTTLIHQWHPGQPKDQNTERNQQLWFDQYSNQSASKLQVMLRTVGDFGDLNKVRRHLGSFRVVGDSSGRKIKHLHVLYDVEGWAYWHRAQALKKYAPPDWRVTFGGFDFSETDRSTPDIVLCLNYGQIEQVVNMFGPNGKTQVIGGFNVGWPRRLDHLIKMTNICDHVLINNHDCYVRAGQLPNTYAISNGVDQTVFYPQDLDNPRRRKRVLWIGSQYHSELKGWPHILRPLAQILRGKGFECDFRVVEPRSEQRMEHAELAKWYNSGAIYIIASTSEGTPNPLLESASCGLIPVATRVGNVPELVEHGKNGYIVRSRTVQEFVDGVEFVDRNYDELQKEMFRRIGPWHWEERAVEYFAWFDRIVAGQPYGLESIIEESGPSVVTENAVYSST